MSPIEEADPNSATRPYWWGVAWIRARDRVIAITTELITSAFLLVALAFFYLVLRLLIAVGVSPEKLKIFEDLDYWAIFAVFATFSVTFVLVSIIGAFGTIKVRSTE